MSPVLPIAPEPIGPTSTFWAMTYLRDWIAMYYERPPFRTGRTIPFP